MIDPKDVAVIGLGPAGVSAAIYLKRYGMNPIAFERELVGGKVNKTETIENDAGILAIKGPQLGMLFEKQLASFDIRYHFNEVKGLTRNEDGTFHIQYGRDKSIDVKYAILANGLGEKPFPIAGEEAFRKRGISRCAICDGPLYKGKAVAVIGAGNSAFEEASYLATICSHVTLVARRTQFRATEAAVKAFRAHDNVTLLAPYEALKAYGEQAIQALDVVNKETGDVRHLEISALFLYVGEVPTVQFIGIEGLTDERGYLVTDKNLMTKVSNLYAVGDARDTSLRQVATAVSDGAIAATSIHDDYLASL